jgi:hypothetical protein
MYFLLPLRGGASVSFHPDPFDYRWFAVFGTLNVAGKQVYINHGAHADELPEGDAGKQEIAERLRKHYAELYEDPGAAWAELTVEELPPEDAVSGSPPL